MIELTPEAREIAEQYVIKLEAHKDMIEILKVTMEAIARVEAGITALEKKLEEHDINVRDIEIETDES